jgi:hypothetical protein
MLFRYAGWLTALTLLISLVVQVISSPLPLPTSLQEKPSPKRSKGKSIAAAKKEDINIDPDHKTSFSHFHAMVLDRLKHSQTHYER